jgi:hypothetical protein
MTEQFNFFEDQPSLPDGLRYRDEFITAPDERELLNSIRSLPFAPFQFGEFEGKRRVVSFGWKYDYSLRRLQSAEPIPTWLDHPKALVADFIGQVLEGSELRRAIISPTA